MADTTPLFINSYTRAMGGLNVRNEIAGSISATNVPSAANRIYYLPLSLPWTYTVNRVFVVNGSTIAGNVAMGIYKVDGTGLYQSSSVAQAGALIPQYFALGSPLVMASGFYMVGIAWSNATATFCGASAATTALGSICGMLQQDTAGLPLPANATFAAWASVGYPYLGITRTTSGF